MTRRPVDRPDANQIKADKGQTINSSNFHDDINPSGRVDRPDYDTIKANKGHSIP